MAERLVPDYVLGALRYLWFLGLNRSIKLSPACWIHDQDYELAPPTWEAFHDDNNRLYDNLKAIVISKTKPGRLQNYALKYPEIYVRGVETGGAVKFWAIKYKQGHKLPASAAWIVKRVMQ